MTAPSTRAEEEEDTMRQNIEAIFNSGTESGLDKLLGVSTNKYRFYIRFTFTKIANGRNIENLVSAPTCVDSCLKFKVN